MARRKEVFEPDLRDLITKLSGFRESDENFRLCLEFAHSNIKYHRFLDVDSHKVTRAVDGLVTKFQINSEYDQAESLKPLVEDFLDTPLNEKYGTTKTDAHYSVIQLLLNLADSPVNADYVKPTPQPEPGVEEDGFDWGGFLLDGEDTTKELYPESSGSEEEVDSDDESEAEDGSDSANQSSGKVVKFVGEAETVENDDNKKEDNSVSETLPDELKSILFKRGDWLEKNVMVQYWKGEVEHEVWAYEDCSNLYTDWDNYQWQTDPLYSVKYDIKVTESQIMREVVWMLSGVKELFVCHYHGGRFHLRDDLAMSHLTKESLKSRLEVFFQHGAQIQHLQNFITRMCNQTSCYNNNSDTSQDQASLTYQTFAQWVSQFLQQFKTYLIELEMILTKQEETFSIQNLSTTLKPWLTKIGLVYDVYYHGTRDGRAKGDNTVLTVKLLSCIYDTLLECDDLCDESSQLAPLLLYMLVQTSRPYIDIMDDWITKGTLSDPRKEFLIQRNESVECLDENFWERAFSLRSTTTGSSRERDDTVTSHKTELSSAEGDTGQRSPGLPKRGGCWAPRFLQPVLKEVVFAGKSMELLQSLGRLGEVINYRENEEVECKSWYATFVESLAETIGTTAPSSTPPSGGDARAVTLVQDLPEQKTLQYTSRNYNDLFLQMNFAAILNQDWQEKYPIITEDDRLEKSVSELRLCGLQPIPVLLEQCLHPYVHRRYQRVCLKLVEVLKRDFHLLRYLHSMRKFYLMEAGDALFDFYTQLFERVQSHEMWRNFFSLNMAVKRSLEAYHSEDVRRLRVDMKQKSYKAKDSTPINAFDGLQLYYKVPWPLDIIISSQTQQVYNQVFVFLMQIKYAKYSLDQLRFTVLERENLLRTIVQPEDAFSCYGNGDEDKNVEEEELPRGHQVHRMQLLRMRLINFVNILHTYIMTRILHSTGLEFIAEVNKAADLDRIISLHRDYVQKIQDRCLQHKGFMFLKEAILKVLNLSVIFSTRWQRGVDEISAASIDSLEVEFGKYMQFLSSFLNNVMKRGAFPHLEPLVFALITSSEQITAESNR